ncbi:MAG TPA: hypothetical protein VK494_04100 [Gemmatimonadaceae bacterium]|jgi:hypothetical protein|nr:hypothetical protein [Gemmatimonadaceae bacterium]
MKLARSVSLAATFMLAGSSVGAQEPAAEQPVTPHTELYAKIARAVHKIHSVFGAPVHPLISGVAPGGGWGAGLGYNAPGGGPAGLGYHDPGRGPWDVGAKAIYTLNNYWLAEGIAGYKNRRAQVEAFGRWREMRRLDYFGSGPTSSLSSRTSFSLRDPVVGAHGKFRVAPWLALGGRVEEIWPYASSGKRSPTIEQLFFPADAPGLFAPVRYGRYQGSVDIELPPAVGNAFYQGTKSRLTYAIYDQQISGLSFDFRRVDVEAQQVFAGLGAHHRLTLSGWAATSVTNAGQEVPFHLQPTLGGKSAIRSVHEHRLGSDGTDATLRGYRNLRFRDRNLLLVQAEYRVPLWGPVDATVFADAGKVAPTRSDLDFTDLRRDVGFSLSIMKAWTTWARVDVGFGSGEGTRVFFTLGELTP